MRHDNAQAKEAAKRVRLWYGKDHAPRRSGSVDFPHPRVLIRLGKAVAVEYESDKPLRGSRRARLFRHKIGAGVSVYTDSTGRWLFIAGGRFRVTDWLRG